VKENLCTYEEKFTSTWSKMIKSNHKKKGITFVKNSFGGTRQI